MKYWPSKTPRTIRDQGLNWGPTLSQLGDPIIVSSEWERREGDATVNAVGGISADGKMTVTTVSGGTPGLTSIFRNTVTLSNGSVLDEDVFQRIRGTPPLATIDFQNGLYRLHSQEVLLDELLIADARWSGHDPASIIPDTGWQVAATDNLYHNEGLVSTPLLFSQFDLDKGVIFVLDYDKASTGGLNHDFEVGFLDNLDAFNFFWDFQLGVPNSFVYDGQHSLDFVGLDGTFKTAILVGPRYLGVSRSGGDVLSSVGLPAPKAGIIGINLTTQAGAGTATITLRRIDIYHGSRPLSALKDLSAG